MSNHAKWQGPENLQPAMLRSYVSVAHHNDCAQNFAKNLAIQVLKQSVCFVKNLAMNL